MVNIASKDNNNKTTRELRIRAKEVPIFLKVQSFEDQMLSFMGENKRLLNIHEQKFAKLVAI